ncbi:MAG: hypothetical protein EOP53_13025, partial [Sphingobacteriales bacterium]
MRLIFLAVTYLFQSASVLYKHRVKILFAIVIIANFWQKLYYINYHSVWVDEAFTLWMGLRPFKDAWQTLTTFGGDAPLYFIIMNLYVKVFGVGNFAARFLSILFSTATVGILFFTGKKFVNTLFAVSVCVLYITSSFFLHYSLEIRPYALAILLASLSIYFYLSHYKQTSKNALLIIALGVCNALMFYTHFLSFLLIVVEIFAAPILFIGNFEKYKRLFYSLLVAG